VERGQHSREWVHCARFVIQFSPIFPASASIFRAFHSLIDGGAGAADTPAGRPGGRDCHTHPGGHLRGDRYQVPEQAGRQAARERAGRHHHGGGQGQRRAAVPQHGQPLQPRGQEPGCGAPGGQQRGRVPPGGEGLRPAQHGIAADFVHPADAD